LLLAFADDEPGALTGGGAVNTLAHQAGDGWTISGVKTDVLHGDCADRLVVTARAEGSLAVFLVDAAASGLSRRSYRTFDGLQAAEVTLDGVRAPELLAIGPAAEHLVERVRQHAIAYMAGEAAGLMDMLLDASVEHLKARRQFGQSLSGFQALKHRCAEMLVALEQARSMAIYAHLMLAEPDPVERGKAFAAVKSVIGAAGVSVGHAAVQLHGGLGVSEEHRVGWALRRLVMIDMTFGDGERWAGELARLGGFVASA
jgi:alkylation response protein AidB-like acyl-CoA dehydrogenase